MKRNERGQCIFVQSVSYCVIYVWLGLYLYTQCSELIVNQLGVTYYNGLSIWLFHGGCRILPHGRETTLN